MKTTPILFVGDTPSLTSGLGRIGRDLATRVATMPEFRVGYLGRGGTASRYLPFPQYILNEATDGWGENHLEHVWRDFAGHERGVVFTIWDATRLTWLGSPAWLPECGLRTFLLSHPFDLWGYFPVDCTTPTGGLSTQAAEAVRGFARVLAYSRFGAAILGQSVGRAVDWIPHGIDSTVFRPRTRERAREELRAKADAGWGLCEDDVLVGVVAINQPRKDWGLVAAACAQLRQRYGSRFRAWWHTDVVARTGAWDLRALAADIGLGSETFISCGSGWTDRDLANGYSASNVTLAPGMEGFGYPIAESIACGTPVVTGTGHGGTELVRGAGGLTVEPVTLRMEGQWSALRNVNDVASWVEAAVRLTDVPANPASVAETVEHLNLDLLWKGCWEKWFKAGVR